MKHIKKFESFFRKNKPELEIGTTLLCIKDRDISAYTKAGYDLNLVANQNYIASNVNPENNSVSVSDTNSNYKGTFFLNQDTGDYLWDYFQKSDNRNNLEFADDAPEINI